MITKIKNFINEKYKEISDVNFIKNFEQAISKIGSISYGRRYKDKFYDYKNSNIHYYTDYNKIF
jgi:hypothetical protein